MKGTNKPRPHCKGLTGEIGKDVKCAIYENRPSPCRNFLPSFVNGKRNVRCDQARLAKGLRPLRLDDWPGSNKPRRRPA